ncbi:MAG: cation-translocating P-type ATPase [Deltaproteobacteria bacterium]|nr:cation-translocating P-type ATPase [Deltaproteobacteria bacterium]
MTAFSDGCELCGLPPKYGTFTLDLNDRKAYFCCQGCRQVYIMLAEAADATDPADFRHTDLFRRCVEMGIIPRSEDDLAAAAVRPPVAADDAPPGDRLSPSVSEGALVCHLAVEGMWCPACAWVIEETLNRQPGISGAHCNFSTDRLRCAYDPARASPVGIQSTLQRLGYGSRPPDALAADRERRSQFVRFAITAFISMNVMMLSFSLYSGFFTDLGTDAVWKISWPMFFMATAVMLYGGLPLHRRAYTGILSGQPGMEALISIGAISAYSYSVFNLLQGSIHLYFDTTCMLIFLVQLGKILERRAKDRIQEDLGHYYALMPAKVRVCAGADSRGRYVAAGQLSAGDLFRVAEGETLAADGLVVAGRGLVDESSLTGETKPLAKIEGDRLVSGTHVIEGLFYVRAETVGSSSTLGQMLAIMDAALQRKTAVEGRTDRILRVFVPLMIGLAVVTMLVLLLQGAAFEQAFIRGLTVLVISCPCALGLAVPLARVAGVSLAARRGILVQDFSAFDRAGRIDTVVFDKTGTLTQGRWRLQSVLPLAAMNEQDVLALAAGLEHGVDHPIAAEIRRAATARTIEALPVEASTVDARGVAGLWQGRRVRLGSADFAGAAGDERAAGTTLSRASDTAIVSWVFLAVDDCIVARLGFGDRLKLGVSSLIQHLQARSLDILVVSGDSQATSDQVGAMLGISAVRGDCPPVAKAQFIETLRREGRSVAMVGDGVNDAPALASADLSVAVFAGRQLGEEAQAVTLMQGDPCQMETFLGFAARVNRKIEQNLWGSLIYNLVAIPIAMAGWLSPLVAVVAMLLSSLSVTGNTLLLIHGENRAVTLAQKSIETTG